jgi:uncharacterized protein YbjQ (UPF0145 family)
MYKIFVTTIISVFLLTGCSTWSTSNVKMADENQIINENLKTTDENNIIISEKDITDKKYKVLADIEVDVNKTTIFSNDPTKENADIKLIEEALKLGADAVIFVRYGTVGVSLMSWGSLNAKGRAIKFVE